VVYEWGFTDPESMSYDPALPQQPGILFSALIRGPTPIRQVLFPRLAQLAIGCSNPLFNPLAHGGFGNVYTGSSGIRKRALCAVYLSVRLPIYCKQGKTGGGDEYIKESRKRRF